MKWIKRIALVLTVVLVGIQFIPIGNNQSTNVLATDFVKTYNTPVDIARTLSVSCYNCHSNNTDYPWYSKVQPAGLFLENHISKAKAKLNLGEFGSYSVRRQKSKLKSMISQVEKDEMPMASYTFIHRDALLSTESKKMLIDYLKRTKKNLK